MRPRPPIYQRWRFLGAWYRLGDALCIVAGLMITIRREPAADRYPIVAAVAIIVYYLLAELGNMYRSWRGVSAHREAVSTLMCWGCTLATLLLLGFLSRHTAVFSRISIFTWFAVTPVLMLASRIGTRWVQQTLRRLGYNTRSFAIVGVNELAFQLARNIEASPEMGLQLAGFFDDRPDGRNPEIPENLGHCLGTLEELVEQARQGRIDRIYITFPMRAESRIRDVLAKLGDATASVYIVPDFLVFQLLHSPLDRHPRPAGGERLRDAHLRHRRAGEAVLRPGHRQPDPAPGGLADGADCDGDQTHFRGTGVIPAAALRARRPGNPRVEVPHDDRLRGRAEGRAGPAERRASPASGRRCGGFRSTSCRSCSTCSPGACRWSARGRTPMP